MSKVKTTTTTRAESGFWAFVWRHRVGLAPLIAAVAVAVIGTILKFSGVEPYVANTLYIVIGLAWCLANLRMQMESGVTTVHLRQEVWFICAVVACVEFWLFWYHYQTVSWIDYQNIFMIWIVGTLVLAGPYWFNLRRRTKVYIDRMIQAWPELAQGTSLSKTYWESFNRKVNGWTGILAWEKGKLARRRVVDEKDLIESLTDAPPDSVVVELMEGKGNINRVKVTCVEDDPHTEAIPFDGVVADSITDVVNIGKYTDHAEEKTRWWEEDVGGFHRLLAGATRSGKSGAMHLLIAKYGPAADVCLWFSDLKNGTALLPWSPMADWTATTPEEALHMVQCAAQELDRRAQVCAANGIEVWEPTAKDPVILLFFDEIASLIGDDAPAAVHQPARTAVVEIARKGAGLGVLIIPGTQYPTLAALGSSQFKSQLAWRACFRLNQPEQGHYVLPSIPKGVDPYRIPRSRRGTCYVDAEGEFRPAMLRWQYVDREDITRVRDRFGRHTPDDPNGPRFMDGIEDGWVSDDLKEAYRARKRWSIEDIGTLKKTGKLAGTGVTAEDLEDTDTGGDNAEDPQDYALADDDLDDLDNALWTEPKDNVVTVDFHNQIRDDVERVHREDPQRALREEKEREAWLDARRAIPDEQVADAIMEALVEAGHDGVGPRELAKLTNKSERTIHRYLESMRGKGAVNRIGYGKYVLTVQPVKQ